MNISVKQRSLERQILKNLTGRALEVVQFVFTDPEIQALQDYANTVSIKRLGYNDHGPVHMRKTALNALLMFNLLSDRDIPFNLEEENLGTREDSLIAVLIAALLHDLGMSISRVNHEFMSVQLAFPLVTMILKKFYKDDIRKQVVLRSLVIEGIFGHMATQPINSLEAGLVLIGDGCDMEKGRARITSMLAASPRVGDIHKYSAHAIQSVKISAGQERPIKIMVFMTASVGLFQVEEVLFPKIKSSPVRQYIELYAGVKEQELLRYL